MYRLTNAEKIKAMENEDTIKHIGEIQTELFSDKTPESLLYLFPLMEKMVLEIYKLNPLGNAEIFEQGTMRTTLSVINDTTTELIPNDIKNKISYYFDESGARNKLFHVYTREVSIEVNYDEIFYIILTLLCILRAQLDEIKKYEFNKIEFL